MVLLKSLDNGFNDYQVPANARAPRSARKRRLFEKKCGDDKMCAFDLLATVAGDLLLENEKSPSSPSKSFHGDKCEVVQITVKKECPNEDKPVKVETCNGEIIYKEPTNDDDDTHFGFDSGITASDCSDGFDAQKMVNGKTVNKIEGSANSGCSESGNVSKSDGDFSSIMSDKPKINNPPVQDGDRHVVVSLGSSTEVHARVECSPHGPRDDVKLVGRDDDEDFPGYIHPNRTKKSYRMVPRIGNRRIRKILASKYWKGSLRSKDVSRANADWKPSYGFKRNCYKCARPEWNYPIKKRKYFDFALNSNSEGDGQGISDSSKKCFGGNDYFPRTKMHKRAAAASVKDRDTSFVSRDSHVKLRIRSFRVPELFVEIPETATVSSLKRNVMEAVTSILGGGLRVGLLLEGKKVRDDSKTLIQTGISQDTHPDALGFCLEPNSSTTPKLIFPESSALELPCDTLQRLARYASNRVIDTAKISESDHDSAPSPNEDSSAEKSTTDDSRALVPKLPTNPKAFTGVSPCSRKSKRPEVAQRRIRRPFSVAEVEALVHAVEKLGTGRWRDVKLRAFDSAEHRTYVDLKDKWKTLVHTARISAQQRRGEPVPQELLDRVLAAHAYWSQQQQPRTFLLL